METTRKNLDENGESQGMDVIGNHHIKIENSQQYTHAYRIWNRMMMMMMMTTCFRHLLGELLHLFLHLDQSLIGDSPRCLLEGIHDDHDNHHRHNHPQPSSTHH
jgi:hypothetical protein